MRYRPTIIVAILLLCVYVLLRIDTKEPYYTVGENDNEKIVVDTKKGEVVHFKKEAKKSKSGKREVTTTNIEGARIVAVSVKENGEVKLDIKRSGFIFEPGLEVGFSNEFRVGVCSKLYYLRNFNVGIGLTVDNELSHGRFDITGSYTIKNDFISNTSVFAGVTQDLDPIVGISIGF